MFDGSSLIMLLLSLVLFLTPAWLGVTALRVSARGPATVILSPLILFWSVMGALGLGLSLEFWNILWMQTLLSGMVFFVLVRQGRLRLILPSFPSSLMPRSYLRPVAGMAGLVLGLFVIRLWVQALLGFDCPVRWNLLAQRMLSLKNLDFYPPLTAQDFCLYTFPDSIAPIVSGVYWWFYAAAGVANEHLTSIFVALQGAGIVGFVFLLARRMASSRAAVYALAILAASPLAFSSVVIGQETGLLSIAVLGMVYYLDAEGEGGPSLNAAVMGGLALALGALAREYGWALLPLGWLLLLRQRASFRTFAAFSLTGLLFAAPWYLRTWVLTGNPFYPLSIGSLFPVNPVYSAYLKENGWRHGLSTYSLSQYLKLAWILFRRAPLQIIAVIFCWAHPRQRSLLLGSGLFVALWLLSISYTLGGPVYAIRVLGPAVVLLSVGAGVSLDRFISRHVVLGSSDVMRARRLLLLVSLGLVVLIIRAIAFDAVFPQNPESVPLRQYVQFCGQHQEYQYRCESIVKQCSRYFPPGVGILSSDAYPHAQLMDSAYPSVMVWSPEVAFLFDFSLDGEEMRRRLIQKGIGAVVYFPPGEHSYSLELSPFFSQDRKNWIAVAPVSSTLVLYALPPV